MGYCWSNDGSTIHTIIRAWLSALLPRKDPLRRAAQWRPAANSSASTLSKLYVEIRKREQFSLYIVVGIT